MRKLLFIIILIIPFIGFGQNDTIKKYHANGNLKSVGVVVDGKKIGFWKFFHEIGSLHKEGNMVNDKEDGYWRIYYPKGNGYKGKIMWSGLMKNGKENGVNTYYYPNGNKKYTTTWVNGVSHGTFTVFDMETGKIREIGNYVEGKRKGEFKYYDKYGNFQNKIDW